MVILLNRWILTIAGVELGRVCACNLGSRLVYYERLQPVSTCLKNLPTEEEEKNLTTHKLDPKKNVVFIAFSIALTLDVKIVWFGRQKAVCVTK